jgi:hypothetical protein
MGFEDTFTDTYASSSTFFGVTTFSRGTITGEADGYGTLILPNGTFDNVIRVKIVDESVDSTDLGLGIVEKVISTTTTYFWYSAVHPGPLVIREASEGIQVAIVEGLPNDTIAIDPDSSFSFDITATTSSNEFFQTNAFELGASPNPFTEQLNLSFAAQRNEQLEFELRNSLGQIVMRRNINAISGSNQLNFETGSLPPGAYVAILKGEDKGSVIRILKTE